MRIPTTSSVLITATSLFTLTCATSLPPRALSNSPSGGYAPEEVACPDGPLLRTASDISDGEKEFLKKRHEITDKELAKLLGRAGLQGFDVDAFLKGYSPTVALAFSGGGYRAMLSGAGEFKALDSRTPGTDGAGQLGGLLQSSTYVAGLSGGSWLLGSVVINNFTTVSDLQAADNLWDFSNNILAPEGTLDIVSNTVYYDALRDEVKSKKAAGFDVSLTDYWSRALSREFVGWPDGGPGVTWSSIALTDQFKNAEMPFPLVVADGRNPGEQLISENATVYEFNPLEFGSFDPQLYTFTPLEFIGSNVTEGVPVNKDTCIRGFDNAGFIMGTSSSLFNQLIFNLDGSGVGGPLKTIAEAVLVGLGEADADIADYSPNPFFGVNPSTNPSAATRDLTLVDGGEDLQNLPLHPLIQPPRAVDVIFAFDNSADTLRANGDTSNWPNGTALVATYERSLIPEIANGTQFPAIPDINTFINKGLNNRPTFFGCDAGNFSSSLPIPPLVVYLPNTPWTFLSNTSTLDMEYTTGKRDLVIGNGWNIATQGNSTEWATCVACAIVLREIQRNGDVSEQCRQCLSEYCWDGSLAPFPPQAEYDPVFKTDMGVTSAAGRVGWSFAAVVGAVVVAVVGGVV